MRLMRNAEVLRMLLAMLAIALAAAAFIYALIPAAAAVALIACALTGAVCLLFTRRRYEEIARLSDYLKRANVGEYSLELPDNEEGELSILKSEIYKVTVSLRERGEQLKREKSQLADSLWDISHQFKTPLTSMSVMADLLQKEQLDDATRLEFARHLCGQLGRLKWLTDALLKLSRLDAGAVSFDPRRVSARELIEKACAPLLIPIEIKGQELTVQADEGFIRCDPYWTAEALLNVIKNCVEHTPPGGQIRIRAAANALFFQISIQDSGPGIDRADLPFVFERFYRGKHAVEDSAGIGLAMARAILLEQGALIEAHSDEGGAEFILRFPVSAP